MSSPTGAGVGSSRREFKIMGYEQHREIELVAEPSEDGHHFCLGRDVEGMAFRTGSSELSLDPRDPIGRGFVFR